MIDPVYWMEHPSHLTQIRLRAAHEQRSDAYWRAIQSGSTLDNSHYEQTTHQYGRILSAVQNEFRRERGRKQGPHDRRPNR